MASSTKADTGPLILVLALVAGGVSYFWGYMAGFATFFGSMGVAVVLGAMLSRSFPKAVDGVGEGLDGDYEAKMRKAGSRNERRWIHARHLAGQPGLLLEEVDGVFVWFIARSEALAKPGLISSGEEARIGAHMRRGAAIAASCKSLAQMPGEKGGQSRVMSGLLLHHIAPMMTIATMGMPLNKAVQVLDDERAEFLKFIKTCPPDLATELKVLIERCEQAAQYEQRGWS